MAFSLGEYQDIFLEEADDQLQELNKNLLEMEQNPEDQDTINNIFRAAHSLKSSAAFVGLNDLSELAHKMENLLQGVRDKTISISSEIIDLLFKCFDQINAVIELVSEGKKPHLDLSSIIDDITRTHEKALGNQPSQAEPEKKEVAQPEKKSVPKTVFSANEKKHLKQGLDDGLDCYELTIFIEPDAPMKWVKAQLILNSVKNLAQVVKTIPDEENLTDESIRDVIKIIILTDEDLKDVRNACDVDLVTRIDIIRISLNRRDNKYVIKFGQPEIFQEEEPVEEQVSDLTDGSEVDEIDAAAENEGAAEEELVLKSDTDDVGTASSQTARRNAPVLRTVKVSVDKLDDLLNNVGELVIANSGFFRMYEELKRVSVDKSIGNEFKNRIEQMARIAKDLQSGIMKTRMVPIGQVFSRFHRLIRDVSKDTGKNVQLITKGEDTELDKKVIDVIGEPLIHMIRNSIDHGIESPDERQKQKKSDVATVTLSAHQGGNQIFVEVIDDGRGLDVTKIKSKAIERGLVTADQVSTMDDSEIYNFIFQPGFSTANRITDVSGRGVGMNVVKEVVQDMGGNITIESEIGMGTRFIMAFPLTMAIIPAIMVKISGETYAIPLTEVIETINIDKKDITTIEGHEVINLRGEILSLVRLSHFVGMPSRYTQDINIPVIVVGYSNRKVGLIVDELEGKLEIVIKSLETNYRTVEGLAGASILGDGSIALILDIASMINKVITEQEKMTHEEKLAMLRRQEQEYIEMQSYELGSTAKALPEVEESTPVLSPSITELPVIDESIEEEPDLDLNEFSFSSLKEKGEAGENKPVVDVEPETPEIPEIIEKDLSSVEVVEPEPQLILETRSTGKAVVFDTFEESTGEEEVVSEIKSEEPVDLEVTVDETEIPQPMAETTTVEATTAEVEEIEEERVEEDTQQAEDITEILEPVSEEERIETTPVSDSMNEVADEETTGKVKEALESFRSELHSNVRETLDDGDLDKHIRQSLELSDLDLGKIKLLSNVGITQAAESMSKIIHKRVDMAIPDVRFLPSEKISTVAMYQDSEYISISMGLVGDVKGAVLFSIPTSSGYSLLDSLFGYETGSTRTLDEEGESAIKEITNIVGSSVVNSFSEKTGLSILSEVPALLEGTLEECIVEVSKQVNMAQGYALVMDTEFYYEDDRIMAHLLVLPDTSDLKKLVDNLRDNG